MILKNNKILNWIDYIINIKNLVFTKALLEANLNKFWSEIIDQNLSDNQHIWLLFRLQWNNGEYVTIGKLQRLNREDKDYILNFIIDEIEDKDYIFNFILDEIKNKGDYYLETSIISVIFSYGIRDGKAP